MNKKCRLLSALLLSSLISFAQQPKISLLYNLVTEKRLQLKTNSTISLFTNDAGYFTPEINRTLSERTILSLNRQACLDMYRNRPASITLIIPSATGNDYRLELIQQDITGGEFSFGTLHGNGIAIKNDTVQGLHYRGYVNGDPSSIAGFSVFANGEVMGLFCNNDGNFNIGEIADHTGKYILYNSKNMQAHPGFECATSELLPAGIRNTANRNIPTPADVAPPLLCKKVRLYWEADYKLYNNNFTANLTNTSNYMKGLFNQVAVMYQNEGILIELADMYIWTTADPYTTSTSSNGLSTFKARWNGLGDTFKGDLAVLIDGGPTNNGGVAYLLTNNLCFRYYAYGYANVYATYNTVPAYSWDVEVVTHEMGHMVGSNHTHWCGWNTGAVGACGAIDDCYTTEAGGTGGCTTCAATTSTNPTAPAGFQGTVMSYCHLRSGIGINLANGFGPLPQAAIRNTVNTASCALYDNKWTGAVSTAWENAGNWGCGFIPDINTDVTIPTGVTNYPVVNSAAVCRSIKQQTGTSVLVTTGFSLKLAGQGN